ncbi:MAG TPA: lamin tail domain-containing protein, partial [Puia sp.]|nr:lamin tail domain-containing protein [Puia sp.]
STVDYNIHNWSISNGNNSATIKVDYILKADSFLILCANSAAVSFAAFGASLGISGFPALNNDGGIIALTTETGIVIHAVQYDKNWFDNDIKASGGWSLEMKDPANPCTGMGNWAASISPDGGTPGKKNSVNAQYPDPDAPSLIRAMAVDSLNLVLLFDEATDSASASDITHYSVSDGIGFPEKAIGSAPFFDRVELRLQHPLATGKLYTVSAQQLTDCTGNEIGLQNECKTGLPEKVKPGDIIFNEILFNPPSYGYDYLELYNRSSSIINCSELWLAARELTGNLKDPVNLVKEERAFFPGEYLLLTENPDWIVHHYPNTDESGMIPLSPMPSLPDDIGKVVLLNTSADIIDELDYDHHWHSPMLSNENGVALERIRTDLATELASNWTSATAASGYGTPGYKNSEYSGDSTAPDFISVEPKVFSPDMDGYQDFLFIHYHLPTAGFIGTISIYDIYGRMARKLVDNILWGTAGSFRWDGLDEQQRLLPMGHYILIIQLYLPDGTIINRKLVATLAR